MMQICEGLDPRSPSRPRLHPRLVYDDRDECPACEALEEQARATERSATLAEEVRELRQERDDHECPSGEGP